MYARVIEVGLVLRPLIESFPDPLLKTIMGGQQSSADAEREEVKKKKSKYEIVFKRLYAELTASDDAGAPATDVFKSRFETYFGGPNLEFGRLLYEKLFGPLSPVDEETFVSALAVLERVSGGEKEEHMETESFFFSMFSEGKDAIERQQMIKILQMSGTFAMVIGSELHEQAALPNDHFLLTSIREAAWLHADKGVLHKMQFAVWVSRHCPRLLEGMKQWLLSLLHSHSTLHQHGGVAIPQSSVQSLSFQLPTLHWDKPTDKERQLTSEREVTIVMWVLSTILPLTYFGHKDDGRKNATPSCDYPVGGSWTLLYSSSVHGFSMNRFQHHCSDYREPSVMLLHCHNNLENKEYMFALAMDSEWRDGTYFYGGEKFCFVQLLPTFVLMKTGPKLVSLNEKQRGFPTGLRVMSSIQYNHCLLAVESSLETAQFQGVDLVVRLVEVWGCGGVEAMESQKRMKDWEKRLILRQRKIQKANLKEVWVDSPDRFILELAGVPTQRPQEQQQD